MSELLGSVVRPIQITPDIAHDVAAAIQSSDAEGERQRLDMLDGLDQRRVKTVAKLDRGYDDFIGDKISEEFWERKSPEWEAELQTVDGERARLQQPLPSATITPARIVELVRNADLLYRAQVPTEQRRLLEAVFSSCKFDCGTLSPSYRQPFEPLICGTSLTHEWPPTDSTTKRDQGITEEEELRSASLLIS